ncbi:uncharacterized protein LOC131892379 [Tigriopus californicus]|uniref:uncharacterized protein LOC131892379 n=1 Tax=Tigriopus californicus TaxID=6832 RepID=UPI0027DA1042|nr:uncharacterized protein LOC131892379 [Tigriopus californicus]
MDNHEINRGKLCLICGTAFHISVIPIGLSNTIRTFYMEDYSLEDSRLPSAVCKTCLRRLYSFRNGDFSRPIAPYFDWSSMASFRRTRVSLLCSCHPICARASSASKFGSEGRNNQTKRKVGNPNLKLKSKAGSRLARLCGRCLSPLYPGCSHKCGAKALLENLETRLPQATRDQMIIQTLKRKSLETNDQAHNLKLLRPGNPIKIANPFQEKAARTKTSKIPDELIALKNNVGLSNKQTLKISSSIRRNFGSNAIETGVAQALTRRNRLLKDYFTQSSVYFPDDQKKSTIVWCHDLAGLIRRLRELRGTISDENEIIRISIDKGGRTLKMTMSLVKHSEIEEKGNNAGQLSIGVMKMTCNAVAHDVSEGYNNCKKILSRTQLNALPFKFQLVCVPFGFP